MYYCPVIVHDQSGRNLKILRDNTYIFYINNKPTKTNSSATINVGYFTSFTLMVPFRGKI